MSIDVHNTSAKKAKRPSHGFGPASWKYVLKLLGLMIVADGKTVKEQVDTYQDVMMELAVVIDPTIVMTRRMVFDWFVTHKEELEAVIDGLEYDSSLIAIFQKIRNMPHKLDVVNGMLRVALADGHYSNMEKMFIKKTILYWNVRGGDEFEDRGARPLEREDIVRAKAAAW